MKIELLCCIGAFLWVFIATFAWSLCRAAGIADERLGYE